MRQRLGNYDNTNDDHHDGCELLHDGMSLDRSGCFLLDPSDGCYCGCADEYVYDVVRRSILVPTFPACIDSTKSSIRFVLGPRFCSGDDRYPVPHESIPVSPKLAVWIEASRHDLTTDMPCPISCAWIIPCLDQRLRSWRYR